ncbi:Cholinesterase [Exaiptasia diaphana]|nr:Cholinesterase [Exaiptasia diaphana]
MLTTGQFLTSVTVDGEFLPDDPESLLKEGKLGAHHHSLEDDISFLLPGNYSALEQGLSKYVMEMWANFAKYGDPNGVGAVSVKWPAYNNTGRAHLSISTDPKVKYSLRARKVTFWNEFMPKLKRRKSETGFHLSERKHQKPHKEGL